MEQSTLHIKAPHEVHIGAKARAALHGKSMNQYVVDLIRTDLGEKGLEDARAGIRLYRESTDSEKKVLEKAMKVIDKMQVKDEVSTKPSKAKLSASILPSASTKPSVSTSVLPIQPSTISPERLTSGLCKIHGTPLDDRGRCLMKGCKYS